MIEQLYRQYNTITDNSTAAAMLVLAHILHDKPKSKLTVKEAAERLGLSESTVYAMCQRGELKHQRAGRGIRIEERDLTPDSYTYQCLR